MLADFCAALVVWAAATQPAVDPFPFAAAEAELSAAIRVEELRAHVYRLASPDFQGRRGPGGARASRHIADAFASLNLQPAFDGSFFQPIPYLLKEDGDGKESFLGRNVAAVLPGSDPKLKDEWIVLSAHYDHLGIINGVMYPGADDNASSVAMLLEVAEQFALKRERPRRTIVFVAFDQEEAGLLGSRHFAAHPPRDLRKLKCFLTADMLGRSMANLMDEYVFALGSESAARLRAAVDEVPHDRGIKVGRLGADLIGTRSDYGPFRDRRIPFLFFSTGQHPDYHRPSDTPDKIDYVRLQRISQWIADVTRRLADDPEPPVWRDAAAPDLDEVRTILQLLTRVVDHPEVYPLTERQRGHVGQMQRHLTEIVDSGTVTPLQRTWLLWSARLLLATVF
jgi:hypothetical protein